MWIWRWAHAVGRWLWRRRPYDWSADAKSVMYVYGRRDNPELYRAPKEGRE